MTVLNNGNDQTSNSDLQDAKKFFWSPPSDAGGKTYTLKIEGESEDLVVDVYDVPDPENLIAQYDFSEEDGNIYQSLTGLVTI